MDVWVYEEDMQSPLLVQDGEGEIVPEEWVREHGVRNYRRAIYFFATLTTEEV